MRSHTTAILPDIHFPDHDILALECALRVVEYKKPDQVVLLGDVLDCAAFSRHPKRSVKELEGGYGTEVRAALDVLDRLQAATKALVIVEGNHEHRVQAWCAAQAQSPRLAADVYAALAPANLLARRANGRPRKNFRFVPYTNHLAHYAITPDLWAIHGWSVAANAAKAHLDKTRSVSVVHGHTHRFQVHTSVDPASGRRLRAWCPGTLSRIDMPYMAHSPSDWVHGLSVVYQSRRDPRDWTPEHIEIVDGRAIVGTEVAQIRG